MRRLQFSLTAALLAVFWTGAFAADQQNPKHPPIGTNPNPVIWGGQPRSNAPPIGTNPNPVIWGGKPQPNGPPIGTNPNPITWGGQSNKPAPSATQPANNSSGNVASSTYPVFEGVPYRYATGTLIYNPFTGQYQYYPSGYGSYGYPAVYVSPDVSYGPQAAQRFTSADTRSRWKNDGDGAPLRRDDEMSEPKKTSERDAGSQSNSLAWKFIGFGDARFAEQKYLDANDRYRSAARSAPQLAEPLFREGFAMIALGHYQQATTAIKARAETRSAVGRVGF